jgi:ADP-ribose pyrophosphatase YjhB (NUDIX family)
MRSPLWLSDEAYRQARETVPIACVDVLPWRDTPAGRKIGLITRMGERGQPALSLVGGRVLRNETLEAALARHLSETLGTGVSWDPVETARPLAVVEYFPEPGAGPFVDPAKHAVAMTYATRLHGEPRPAGEAHDFAWFDAADSPPPEQFGFGHGEVVRRLLRELS